MLQNSTFDSGFCMMIIDIKLADKRCWSIINCLLYTAALQYVFESTESDLFCAYLQTEHLDILVDSLNGRTIMQNPETDKKLNVYFQHMHMPAFIMLSSHY